MTRLRRGLGSSRHQRGFSLIEVMIAVLVLGVGLLAFAMLQTMSVRFSQSANKRTQATNLSYEMLDQMRVNRVVAVGYAGNYAARQSGCGPVATVGAASYKAIWECRLNSALGADARASVTYVDGLATVSVTWGDARWNDADRDGTVSATESDQTFSMSARL